MRIYVTVASPYMRDQGVKGMLPHLNSSYLRRAAFVRMDESTLMMTKGRYARVTVEVDSGRPLVPGTDVVLEGIDAPVFWKHFECDHIHLFCPLCGCISHRLIDCKSPPPSPTNNLSSSQTKRSSSLDRDVAMASVDAPVVTDDDKLTPIAWTLVRRHGLNPRQPTNFSEHGPFASRARIGPSALSLSRA